VGTGSKPRPQTHFELKIAPGGNIFGYLSQLEMVHPKKKHLYQQEVPARRSKKLNLSTAVRSVTLNLANLSEVAK